MSEKGRDWPRLGMVDVGELSDEEQLARIVKKLDAALLRGEDEAASSPLTKEEYRNAAWFLRRLLGNPKALRALESTGRGRKLETRNLDIALDYLAQRELQGKAAAARRAVAQAWGIPETRVRDAWTNYAYNARLPPVLTDRLAGRQRIGKPRRRTSAILDPTSVARGRVVRSARSKSGRQ